MQVSQTAQINSHYGIANSDLMADFPASQIGEEFNAASM